MGLFDFLSRKKQVELSLDELEAWLNMQVSSKNLDNRISKVAQKVEEIKVQAHERINNLESAQLMNENIPARDKHIMEGHRKTFIQRARRFIEGISVPSDFSDVGHTVAVFSENLSNLSSDTHKNQLVVKQFFDQELLEILRKIKEIGLELANLQAEIDRAGTEQIKEAKIRLKQYRQDIKHKNNLEMDKTSKEAEFEVLKSKKDKIEKRLHELKQSSEYSEFRHILDLKKKHEDDLFSIEQKLVSIFSELSRPLKKFTHNTASEKLVDKYISDPVGALEDDTSLIIIEVTTKMKEDLHTLELKDKQLEKVEDILKILTRDFLAKKRNELTTIKEQSRELAVKINKSVVALNISESESWCTSLSNKVDQVQRELQNLERQFDEINPQYLFQKIAEKISEVDGNVRLRQP